MRSLAFAAAVVAAFALSADAAMYKAKDEVVLLEGDDFRTKVLADPGVWLIEIYADWCGHCKSLAPEWVKAAKALKGIVKVGAINGDDSRDLAGKLGAEGFPTILIMGENKNTPIKYQGARDSKSIIEAAMKEVNGIVAKRTGGKKASASSGSKSSGSGSGNGGGAKADQKPAPGFNGGKNLVKVTAANFDKEVLESSEAVMVEFYAPWCGHCKNLAPAYAEAAGELEGEVKFVAVDADAERSLGERFGVKGFPTLKYFPPGKKTDKNAQDYNGGRTADEMVTGVRGLLEASGGPAGKLVQLTDKNVWSENCVGNNRICVVAFLPHILDESASKRKDRLEALTAAAGKVGKANLFRFLWSEAGAQPELEEKLNTGMFPAIYAISGDKKIYVPYKGSFDTTAIAYFAQALAVKVEGAQSLPKTLDIAANIKKAGAWDGKDAKIEAVDEIPLEDL